MKEQKTIQKTVLLIAAMLLFAASAQADTGPKTIAVPHPKALQSEDPSPTGTSTQANTQRSTEEIKGGSDSKQMPHDSFAKMASPLLGYGEGLLLFAQSMVAGFALGDIAGLSGVFAVLTAFSGVGLPIAVPLAIISIVTGITTAAVVVAGVTALGPATALGAVLGGVNMAKKNNSSVWPSIVAGTPGVLLGLAGAVLIWTYPVGAYMYSSSTWYNPELKVAVKYPPLQLSLAGLGMSLLAGPVSVGGIYLVHSLMGGDERDE